MPNRLGAKERRSTARIQVDDLCEMIMELGQTKKTCLVHNLSSHGAMIEISVGQVPERFILHSCERSFRVACRVVWHCGGLAGVEFLTGISLAKQR